ncbi:chorismate mutase family protein [Rhodococcus sp. NPDC003348]
MDDSTGSTRIGSISTEVPEPERRDPRGHELEGLRAELDGIDDRLLDDIRARIEICSRIALVKRRHAIPMMQPRRVGAVHEHAHSYALDHDLSPQFLHDVYDLLIAETCRVEDQIIAVPTAEDEAN